MVPTPSKAAGVPLPRDTILKAFFPIEELLRDGFGAGHSGGFAGGEGAVQVEDFSPVGFERFMDFFDFGMGQFVEGTGLFFSEGDEGTDEVMGFAESDALLDEVIDHIGGEKHGIRDGGGALSGDRFDSGETSGEDLEDEKGLIGGIKDGRFVFLEIAVIGKGESLHEGAEGLKVAVEAGGLAPDELEGIGVFLLGHEAGTGGEGVGELHEAELGAVPKDTVLREAGEVESDGVAGGGEVEVGVAVADGVHAVIGQAGFALGVGKAEFKRDKGAVDREGGPRNRTGTEGANIRLFVDHREAVPVAVEHFHVSEEVVRHGDGLGALQMGVARDENRLGTLRESVEFAHCLGEGVVKGFAMILEPETHIGGDLVVATAGGVEFRGGGLTFGEGLLDIHVHVFESGIPFKGAGFDLRLDGFKAGVNGVAFFGGKDADMGEHGGMGAAAFDVVGGEAVIKGNGFPEAQHERVRAIAETSAPGGL